MKLNGKVVLGTVLAVGLMGQVQAGAVEDLQAQYEQQGAVSFSATAGEQLWLKSYKDPESGDMRNCQTCHGKDLKAKGKHVRTGKVIEPLAPSANSERLTDVKFIKKWFKRNCKWTLGRECTAQEKGDFLEYLKGQ